MKLILGASIYAGRVCPGGPLRKSIATTTSFIGLDSMYTINSAIKNPEGISQIRQLAESMVNRGGGNPPVTNNLMDDSALSGLSSLYMQYNILATAMYALCLCIIITIILAGISYLISNYREIITSRFTNRFIRLYISYQYVLVRTYLYFAPLFSVVCLGFITYGLHFMVNNPLPEVL